MAGLSEVRADPTVDAYKRGVLDQFLVAGSEADGQILDSLSAGELGPRTDVTVRKAKFGSSLYSHLMSERDPDKNVFRTNGGWFYQPHRYIYQHFVSTIKLYIIGMDSARPAPNRRCSDDTTNHPVIPPITQLHQKVD